jgi:hypothetical protein
MVLSALLVSLAIAGDRAAPEVSTDGGVSGGVVVLWPRVVPSGRPMVARAAGWQVQRALAEVVGDVAPERAITIRPDPERVCPREGCSAARVGAVVVRKKGSCAVVATVGGPGLSPLTLVPWVGAVQLGATEVPFREPPESWISVRDFVPCDRLAVPLAEGAGRMRNAVEALMTK